MTGIHHSLTGIPVTFIAVPPSVPANTTPTGTYYTFTSSQPFTINGVLPVNAALVVVGGGAPGTGGSSSFSAGAYDPKLGYFPPVFTQTQGSGGKSGVVNYQASTPLSPGSYSVVVGAANSASELYKSPTNLLFSAAGAPGNTNTSPGTGGAGSSAPGSGTTGGAGTPTVAGTYGGGGGGGPGGSGGSGGGGPAGNPGVPGTANTGSGGGGGNAPGPPGSTSSGGNGAAGVVVVHVPFLVFQA